LSHILLAVLAAIKNQSLDVGKMSPSALVQTLADILEEKMGGTIGAREFTVVFLTIPQLIT
jgi:hypothetical protein